MPPELPPSDDDDIFELPPAVPPPLPKPVGNERREWTRAPYITPVHVMRRGQLIECRTDDVSEGGIALAMREPLSNDEQLIVKLCTPLSGTTETFNVVVKWTKGDRAARKWVAGVSFLAVTDRARSRIAAYTRAFVSEAEAT
jgi:hypothetical protein